MHQDLAYIWTAAPTSICSHMGHCDRILLVDGCASCSFAHGPFDAEGDPMGLIAASAIAPATNRPARRASRNAGWNY